MRVQRLLPQVCFVAALGLGRPVWANEAPDVPSAEELAPIVIPSSEAAVTPFATALDRTCASLAAAGKAFPKQNGAAAAGSPSLRAAIDDAARFKAALSRLAQTCAALEAKKLSADDWQNLRAFRKDPDPSQLAALIESKTTGTATASGAPPALALDSAGSLAQTLIAGVAEFLYDRSKAQAALYLTARLKEKLCSPERRPFFPHLCPALETIELNLPLGALGTYVIAAARKDLEQLPDTTLVYALHEAEDPDAHRLQCDPKRRDTCNVLFAARFGLAYYRAVASGRKPLDAVRGLHEVELRYNPAPGVFSAVKNGSALLDAVYTQQDWRAITTASGRLVACHAAGVHLALEESIQLALPDDLTLSIAALPPLVSVLDRLIRRADAAHEAVARAANAEEVDSGDGDVRPPSEDIASNAPPSASTLTARDYALSATQMLQAALDVEISRAFRIPTADNATALTTLRSAAALGEAITAGQDAVQATLLSLDLLGRLLEAERQRGALTRQQLEGVRAVQGLVPLVTQLASAKSADEAAIVFQNAAAPLDTYALKYKQNVIALNGLVGAAGGSELVSVEHETRASGVVSGFAPIGFHATTPLSDHWHFGALLSVIDLGALVTARFQAETEPTRDPAGASSQTTVPKEPKVDLINIVSPGFFVTLGIAGSPFVAGLGGRVLPARKTETVAGDGTTSSSSTPAFQFLGMLAVDVPILQI
jgi:hypothetical protein